MVAEEAMAESNHSPKPLKMLERVGKELLSEYLEKVVQSNVLKLEADEKEKFNNADRKDKRRVFVDTIKKKQSKVGQVLLQTFLNMDENTNNGDVDPVTEKRPEAPEESADSLKLCPPEDFMRLRRVKANEIYPIKEREGRTRMALIICNTEFKHLPFRQGAIFDTKGMNRLLEDLGYTVVLKENLTAKGMESELKDFAALPEHTNSDSTFLVLMSHGTLHGVCGVMHSNESADVLHYDTVYQIFNNCNCPGLRDKPKVIIVQACRGENRGEVWIRKDPKARVFSAAELPKNVEPDAVELSHVEKDFIAFYSTTPHNLSYRDEEGSYFIIKLISCFQKYAWSCHLLDIFQKVQLSFEKPSINFQMPTIDRASLTRRFYLFPGN
ncbi:caspase-4 isoform X2 [Nannospalax galili]|nr:caspase-4 isoform X2 [Nannospalax galili]